MSVARVGQVLVAGSSAGRGLVFGLGSNLGSRAMLLLLGAQALADRLGHSLSMSKLYETPPQGPPQPDYLNAAALGYAEVHDEGLLVPVREVEALLRRERGLRWGPRTVDVDVLWSAAGPVRSASLEVPHPRLAERDFALAPLLDVVPGLSGRYGASLATLGGPPTALAWPSMRLSEDGGACVARGQDGPDALAAFATWWVAGFPMQFGSGSLAPVATGAWRAVPWDASPVGTDPSRSLERLDSLCRDARAAEPDVVPRGAVVTRVDGHRWEGLLLLGPAPMAAAERVRHGIPANLRLCALPQGEVELHGTLFRPA